MFLDGCIERCRWDTIVLLFIHYYHFVHMETELSAPHLILTYRLLNFPMLLTFGSSLFNLFHVLIALLLQQRTSSRPSAQFLA